jgi:hypothetical protein
VLFSVKINWDEQIGKAVATSKASQTTPTDLTTGLVNKTESNHLTVAHTCHYLAHLTHFQCRPVWKKNTVAHGNKKKCFFLSSSRMVDQK